MCVLQIQMVEGNVNPSSVTFHSPSLHSAKVWIGDFSNGHRESKREEDRTRVSGTQGLQYRYFTTYLRFKCNSDLLVSLIGRTKRTSLTSLRDPES